MSRSTTRSTVSVAALALLLTGAFAACGDDDADAGSDPTSAPEAAELGAEACDAFAGVTAGFVGDPAVAGEAAAELVATVPDDLTDHATAIADAFAAMESDPDATSAPEFVAGWEAVGDAAFAGCDTEAAVDVQGIDFAFDGLPAELPAGRVALRLTNDSESGDPHELVLVKRLPGTDAPVEELLALPPDQLFSQVEMTAVLFVEEPEGSAAGLVDLEAGDYVAVCMLPTAGDETSPHAMHGMTFEIEVFLMATTTPTYTVPTSTPPVAAAPAVAAPATAGRGWTRAGIVAGVLGLATFVVAGSLYAGEDAMIDNARVVAEIQDSTWIPWAYQVLGVATAGALAIFGLGLKRRLEEQPAGSLVPAVAATGILLTAVMCLVGSGISTELFHELRHASETDPDTIAANLGIFNTMGWVWAGAGLTTGAVALAARRGSVGRGLGVASTVATGLIVVSQVLPFQYLALLPAALWVLVAGISLGRSERADRAA